MRFSKATGLGYIALIVCLVLSCAGCAPTSTVVQERLVRPGEINMAGQKQVTIEITGPNSDQFEALLKQQLGKTNFDVLDRKSLNVRNGEIALQQLGVAGGTEPAEKIIPAVVLFRVKIIDATASEQPISRNVSDQNGNVFTQYASAAKASAKASFDVIELATSKLIVTKYLENTQQMKSNQWAPQPQSFGEAQLGSMLANADMNVIGQFIETIMPHYENVNVILYNNSQFPTNETGIGLFQAKNYEQAATQFAEALALAKGQPDIKPAAIAALTSNLAMAYEFGGRATEALDLYNAAAVLDSQMAYSQSITRVQTRFAEAQVLRDQGLNQGPRSFGGVGIELIVWNAQLRVSRVLPNTPASTAGIVPGDIILAINGNASTTMSVDQAAQSLRGDPGTAVTLRINRSGAADKDYTLTRGVINQ